MHDRSVKSVSQYPKMSAEVKHQTERRSKTSHSAAETCYDGEEMEDDILIGICSEKQTCI